MKTLKQLGISPAPWKHTPADEWTHAGIDDANGCGVGETYQVAHRDETAETANARLMAAAPKLYGKAYEVAENLLVHLAVPSQTISMNRAEVAAMVKDLQSALAEAAGESEVER